MEKEKKCIYVGFCNQKGGVGKSAFTVLTASYLYYCRNKNVLVVDCDQQNSLVKMRERDIQMVSTVNAYKKQISQQYERIKKKAYPVVSYADGQAIEKVNKHIEESGNKYDIVFFDLPGTVNISGVLHAILNMDYVFCPIITDQLVLQSSLGFVATVNEYMRRNTVPLQGIYLFWNKIDRREISEVYDVYNKVIKSLELNLLNVEIPLTAKYKKELSRLGRPVFRSTLFPPENGMMKESNFDKLVNEFCNIINLDTDGEKTND